MKSMGLPRRIWCRTVQAILRLATPFLPYRAPGLLKSCDEAAALIKANQKRRVLIVTGANVRAHGLTKPVEDALALHGVACVIYDKTVANPTVSNIEEAVKLYRETGCDCLIAVGGGSPMDCAKGVCARLMRPKKSIPELKGALKVHGTKPLLIAVPTTSGSGSEASVAAVVTDDKTHHKFTVISFSLVPKYALLDPVMTKTLPPTPTAETGMDALTHAVEAYIGRATTRRTREYAISAVKLIHENLLTAYERGDDLEARRNMQLAAYRAGLAFSLSYVGYVHAVAHSLGGKYNYPHGKTNAILLPVVLRAYGKSCEKRLAKLARASGVCFEQSDSAAARSFIEWIETLNEKTGIPETLAIKEEDIPALARIADKEANPLYPVPKLMNAKALEEIYRLARTKD